MRKLLALIMAMAMVLGCVSFAAAEGTENVITIAMETSPCLDPHWNAGSTGAWLQSLMYEGLYTVNETSFELTGATGVDVNDDATVWTFHLRKDAKWNDGQPVTAGDYVYSIQRLVDPDIATTYMDFYGAFIKNGEAISKREAEMSELGVKAIDDYTLEITTQEPCTYLDSILTYSTFYPLRKDVVVEDGTGDWAWEVARAITNGPMNMTYCDEDQEIILEKNPTYYAADTIKLDKLVVKLIDNSTTTLSMLETGEVDLITGFPSEEATRLQKLGLYHAIPALSTNFLLVNCQEKDGNVFTDARIRRALSLCIDREYLCGVLLNGTKQPAVAYVGNGFSGSTPDADFRGEGGNMIYTDEDEARALLAEAGYPEGAGFPVLTCSYANNSADYQIMFEYLQSVWEEELGITVQLEPLDKAVMTEYRDSGKFDITPQGWGADYMDASNMLSIFVTGNFINGGRYSSEVFDNSYYESLKTVDQAARMALLHTAEEQLLNVDMGIIPLYHGSAVAIFSDDVLDNVVIGASGKPLLQYAIHK